MILRFRFFRTSRAMSTLVQNFFVGDWLSKDVQKSQPIIIAQFSTGSVDEPDTWVHFIDGKTYKALQVTIAREGKKPLVATWGGISLKWDMKATLDDQPPQIWHDRLELEQRLLAQVCEHCGTTHMTDQIEVHHIRALKGLNAYEGRDKPSWVKIMAARHRKTMVLCRTCHTDLHAGRPLKQKRSRSRTELLR